MPLLNTVRQFNWLDIFAAIFLFRIGYIALKNGFPQELFKLLGSILALYTGLHYYSSLAGFIRKQPSQLLNLVAFVILVIAGYFIFVLLRVVFCRFIQLEATPQLNRWGGFVLGMFRALFLLSIIVFTLSLPPVKYFQHSVKNSYSGSRLVRFGISTYSGLWGGLVSKFSPKGHFNKAVLEAEKTIL